MVVVTLLSHIIIFASLYADGIAEETGQSANGPIVKMKYGILQGSYKTAFNNRTYSEFTSVPYADPPLGKFRFELAQPLSPWDGIRNASVQSPFCIQFSDPLYQTDFPVIGQEDCLYLNIYTPKLTFEKKTNNDYDCGYWHFHCDDGCDPCGCPVIVFIHGGAFQYLGAPIYGGKYLMQTGKLVVAVINYRLGLMGFLSTEDEVLPGNIGLKDQVKALTFIQENIRAFGGNPNSVTLVGGSAGSTSVHYMYLSPLTRGLFHRGYGMSGTVFCPWSIQYAAKQKAIRLASELGCPTNSSQELVGCLKTKPARDIVILTRLFRPFFYLPISVFGPVIEVANDNAFLTENPYDIIWSGRFQDKPLILSLVEKEGLFPAASFIADETVMALINSRWNDIAPHLLDYNFTVAPAKRDQVSQVIRKFYFDDEEISVQNTDKLVQMVGDRLFSVDISRAVLLQASQSISPLYTYIFYYRGEDSVSELYSHTHNNYGASHADDTSYAMSTTIVNPEKTESDRAMVGRFVNMYTTYACTGVPTFGEDVVYWRRVSLLGYLLGKINYLEIHSPNDFRRNTSRNFRNHNFWRSLPINEPASGRYSL